MMKRMKVVLLGMLVLICLNSSAQNWEHARDDAQVAVEVDTMHKKGFTLIWINKEKGFDTRLKQRLIDTYFLNYPKLVKKYNKKSRRSVTFVIDPDYDGVAATAGGIVRYSPKWFAKNPGDIDVVTHEVMHIVQGYPNGSGPWWITEGIADYVRFVDGVDNAGANWRLPDFKETQQYTDAYRITARFFYWMETKVRKGVIQKLDLAMRTKTYSDDFWKRETGSTVDELWMRYAKNPAI